MVDWNAKYSAVDTLLYGDKPSDIIIRPNQNMQTG